MSTIRETLEESLPLILWRSKWPAYQEKYGLPYSRGTMQNRDHDGVGPKFSKIGGKVCYAKSDYLDWAFPAE